MMAFWLNAEQIDIFIELCEMAKADTKEKQSVVLEEMAKAGLVSNAVHVKNSKQEYIAHLAKQFGNVKEIQEGDLK